jgi:hypothetical protein
MAPQVSNADDIERLSLCLAQLARVQLAGKLPGPQLPACAAAAGLSADEARAWLRGEVTLPSRQSVALISAFLDQQRAREVAYMTVMRQGHAGSDAGRGSYQATVTETETVRGRTVKSTWVRGGPLEVTVADVEATLERLRADFDGWTFRADGTETIGAGATRLVWHAAHAGRDVAVSAATSLELGQKAQLHEANWAAEAKRVAAFYGRG